MAETSSCYALTCGNVVEGTVRDCPKCGRRMRSSRQVRIFGWVLLVVGLFLIGLMGTVGYNLAPTLLDPEGVDGTRFTGTQDQARMILWLFGLVLLFGAISLASGILQIVTGRRSRAMTFAALIAGIGLVATAYATKDALGG